MGQRMLRTLSIAAATISVVTAVSATPYAAAARETSSASAAVVLDWYTEAWTSIAVIDGQLPWDAEVGVAITQGAVYDAVNGIVRSHQPYLAMPAARPRDSQDAAAATASFSVLATLLPRQRDRLQAKYDRTLSAIPAGRAKQGGIAAGKQAADTMLAARKGDGRDVVGPPFVGTQPGQWRPTPPSYTPSQGTAFGNIKPFLVPSAAKLRTAGPNALTSAAYAADFNEVKAYGGVTSTVRTQDQKEAAIFWHERPSVEYAMHHQIAQTRGLNAADAARMFAVAHLVGVDSLIGCFNDKYFWKTWRPVTAIHEAANDGNPATTADPDWKPLLGTPAHPDHPSGHSCVSAGYGKALEYFFHTDNITFSAYSKDSGTTRHFTSFSQKLDEVIGARIWGGIHTRTADVQGAKIGKDVATWSRDHYFRPL
ncbi:vanadium-dependent haloperoxidase [Kibdelosporangium philippinense]|uniref:vanadium-dependent haloperoxidase n=1 Tax=Kibdelosporangium philippinense TaxID=211113 RepID=UPI00360A3D1A